MKTKVGVEPFIWDVVVIGGGPAGSLAATQLARSGLQVLVLERKIFPRPKVCGGCLNAVALRVLDDCELLPIALSASGIPLERLFLRAGGRAFDVPIPRGMAICRSELDWGLTQAAEAAGAEVRFAAKARLIPTEEPNEVARIEVESPQREVIAAQIVVLAAGLDSARRVAPHLLVTRAPPAARVGLGAVLESAPDAIEPGIVFMNVARRSYVGVVRLADGRAVLGAAIDHQLLRRAIDPRQAVQEVLDRCGWDGLAGVPLPDLHGTPPLTRSVLRPASDRLFVIGDAAGYVEPFTGDGMAVAFQTAVAVVPFVKQAVVRWEKEIGKAWCSEYRRLIAARHTWCRGFSELMRHPFLVRAAAFTADCWPALSTRIARQVVGRATH